MMLLGCSDVGPAKYLAELVSQWPGSSLYISSPLSRGIFENAQIRSIENLSEAKNVNMVVSGTSLGDLDSSIDKQVVRWAKSNNIPSVAVIEHWSWYRKRFESKDGLLLPDFIIVNDEIAQQDAVEEGLSANVLRPLGNPYLERLSIYRPARANSKQLRARYNLPFDKRLVVFISEELKDTFKQGTSDYLGYDEYQVLKIIQSVLRSSDHLVVKKHPEETSDKYESFLNDQASILTTCSATDLATVADVVIGMASMLLLELAIFREDVISLRPNASKDFIGERLSVTVPVKNTSELVQVLKEKVKAKSSFRGRFEGSKDRITNFLTSIVQ